MVLAHARSDLAGDAADAGASWLEVVEAVATNRNRLLFFLLAGVGVALIVRRRGVGAGVLLRRAAFVAALGAVLAVAGWSDLVLVFYGVLFVLAVRLKDRMLLGVAVLIGGPGAESRSGPVG
ncbi:hypothetical protein ASG88_21965 [Nocardioides sp. Soil777]|uniref:hypothetical protein n=1 Tax=Nocardioides sp. Soil777 TaxID=1736409 RepID=UPI0007027150|nr:hypothetical protein [Nocardioides sp. Soil777]KRF03474.1 hypothetical protein ASG88_21965 [Nocardioides sp. Soil777]